MSTNEPRPVRRDRRLPHRTLCAALLILIAIPAVILLGISVWDDRRYYLVSILILLLAALPFALKFEQRKPQARELVVLAVMVALSVIAGRCFLAVFPQCKAVMALVILTGVAFGGEAGFIAGAMSMFVSNFFLGQGPWTPWQMFATGIVGFLAGFLCRIGWLRPKWLPLSVFGGLAVILIYGPIADLSSMVIFGVPLTWESLTATLAGGLPFNLIYGASTALFLALLTHVMLEKLDRIKRKFGILEP